MSKTSTKRPSRLARRLANRLAKAVGKANKKLGQPFAGYGVRDVIQNAAAGQFRHFTREGLRRARAEEEAVFGPSLTHRERMLRHKRFLQEYVETA